MADQDDLKPQTVPQRKATTTWGYEVACSDCLNVYRVESIAFPLEGLPKHCPFCSSDKVRLSHDSNKDYFYILAESMGLPYNNEGATIAAEIFDSWDHEEYRSLKEYVSALRAAG